MKHPVSSRESPLLLWNVKLIIIYHRYSMRENPRRCQRLRSLSAVLLVVMTLSNFAEEEKTEQQI